MTTPPKQEKHALWLALGLAISAPIVMATLDLPISRWCVTHGSWGIFGELRRGIMLSEIFGHGWGAILAGVAVYVFDSARRKGFYRPVLAVCAAGIAPTLIKLFLVRYRPGFFFSENFPAAAENVWQTFGGFPTICSYEYQSFPSGHSALACGLAVVMSRFYPRGKIFFGVLASLAMLQRVLVGAHFPSDTLAGAAVGIFIAAMVNVKCTMYK